MALTSCALFGTDNKEPDFKVTDTKIETRVEYLPGKVIVQPVTAPDSSVTEDCGRLTAEFIPSGPDIDGVSAVNTAAAWGRTANDCRDKNLILRGWIAGVVAASQKPVGKEEEISPPEAQSKPSITAVTDVIDDE